ncbi:alkane 1-monooxygenase [Aestuariibius sp. HNIBRBA575]|uniref:alkane 1-monooxygenase n=1 Tax=Aestuariibius sp. HNIBRBA575 TaxID=3233343 RepID=UPI0034A165B9
MTLFAVISSLPVFLISIAAIWGGWWVLAAFFYQTALAALLDELVALTLSEDPDREFPAADPLSVFLAVAHFWILAICIAALSGDTGLTLWEKIPLFLASGLFLGQVSNSNAHELIHRGARPLHRLGKWVYITLLFGHHTSAHPLVHHIHVATDQDPNSARKGESYYRFAKRAWIGSFVAGYRAETVRLARIKRRKWHHPYILYLSGAGLMMALAYLGHGIPGLISLFLLAGFAQSQLLISDYVQHYGLRRTILANGKPEPVSDGHSWNARHWFTSSLMLNAPRHSDHHAHPARPYPQLRLTSEMPQLPRSLPVMATLALWPKHWKRVMDPLVQHQQDAQIRQRPAGHDIVD